MSSTSLKLFFPRHLSEGYGSCTRSFCRGSNWVPSDYQSDALTTWLSVPFCFKMLFIPFILVLSIIAACPLLFSDPKPVVESSFVTEFYDHIKVAMDAEVILFLHDLVSSYIKEKDKGNTWNSSFLLAFLFQHAMCISFCLIATWMRMLSLSVTVCNKTSALSD